MKIEKAEYRDLQEILNLQYLAYQSEAKLCGNPNIPPLRQTLEDLIREYHNGIILKATGEDGAIVGSVRAYSQEGTLHIGKLIVRPDMLGHGIGTQLLYAIENIHPHPRYELFTSSQSVRNITLYQRLGYRIFIDKAAAPDIRLIYLEKYRV